MPEFAALKNNVQSTDAFSLLVTTKVKFQEVEFKRYRNYFLKHTLF